MFDHLERKRNLREVAAAKAVSIWIGDFADEQELSRYIDDQGGFSDDFGCILPPDIEFALSTEPAPARELLDGFARSHEFVGGASSHIIDDPLVRCVVIAFGCDYTLLRFRPRLGRLRFLCVTSLKAPPQSA